ncbi:CHASE3 domain-containing protein [Andreprevotia chitinilytica]|uniref:CHASE3 domain-containing protein n=1 Tax=Andreprevotia chitinilytica TaxID=396808 RepID=UPI00054F998B|nr:CHASE3 domain-containing protein [Andreprevotia chitinilytica]
MKKLLRNLQEAILSAGWKIRLCVLLCLLLPLIAALLSDYWLATTTSYNNRIAATRERVLALRDLQNLILNAESSQRGFLVNGELQYQMSYDLVRPRISQLSAALLERYNKVLDAPDSRSSKQVQQLSLQLGEKLSEMDISVGYAREGKLERARELLNTNRGFELASQIERHITALLHEETLDWNAQLEQRAKVQAVVRTTSFYLWGILLVLEIWLVLMLSGQIARRYRQAKAIAGRHHELHGKVLRQTQALQDVAMEYQLGIEREQAKLARELHDELGSILTATKMDVSWVQREIRNSHPEVSEKLKRTLINLDQGIQFKRRIVQELHPSLLASFGLVASIRSLAEEAAQRCGWALTLTLPDDDVQVNDLLALITYRIVQETLNNAAKYAKASKLSISLLIDHEHLKLEIEDNGVGVDLDALPANTHGLQGIRYRVNAIGGKINFTSRPGEGLFTLALLPSRPGKETPPSVAIP